MATKVHKGEVVDKNYDVAVSVVGGNLVNLGASGISPTGAGGKTIGWVPYDKAAGGRAPVYDDRIVPVIASGAVAVNDFAIPAANGRAAALADAAVADIAAINATRRICGRFLTGGADGTEVLLRLKVQ